MSDEFVGILDGPLLARSVGVGKEDRNTEHTSNCVVISKFKPVVGSNSLEFILIGEQEQDSSLAAAAGLNPPSIFLMKHMLVDFSTRVRMADFCPLATMVSISKSPNLFPSTSVGL